MIADRIWVEDCGEDVTVHFTRVMFRISKEAAKQLAADLLSPQPTQTTQWDGQEIVPVKTKGEFHA